MVGFTVNQRALVEDAWHEIVRYDTHHGHLHIHRFWRAKQRQVEDLEQGSPVTTPRPTKRRRTTSSKTGSDTAASSKRRALRRLDRWIHDHLAQLPDDFVALPFDADVLAELLTRERIRMVDHLRANGPVHALQDLADALGRDRSAVSRDLVLLDGTFVEIEKHGRQKTIRALDRPIVIY